MKTNIGLGKKNFNYTTYWKILQKMDRLKYDKKFTFYAFKKPDFFYYVRSWQSFQKPTSELFTKSLIYRKYRMVQKLVLE